MIHMMEKEEAAEAARRFAAIFLSCTSCLSWLSCSLLLFVKSYIPQIF